MTELHHAYDLLHFVLLFLCSEVGWHDRLRQASNDIEAIPKKLMLQQFGVYRLQVCAGESFVLHQACNLAKEYFVDMFAKMEQRCLA